MQSLKELDITWGVTVKGLLSFLKSPYRPPSLQTIRLLEPIEGWNRSTAAQLNQLGIHLVVSDDSIKSYENEVAIIGPKAFFYQPEGDSDG